MARFQEAERNDPFRNFNFRIVMGGVEVAACRKMSVLEVTVNTVKFRAGNNISTVDEALPGRVEHKPVMFESGLTNDTTFEEWANQLANQDARPERIGEPDFRREVEVFVYDIDNETVVPQVPAAPGVGVEVHGDVRPGRRWQRRHHRDPGGGPPGLRTRRCRLSRRRPAVHHGHPQRRDRDRAAARSHRSGRVAAPARAPAAPAGRQELQLAGLAGGADPADPRAVSAVLAACVARIGGYAPVTERHAAALTRGDRFRITLWLRAMLAGDALVLTVRCPAPGCGTLADLRLSTAELTGDPTVPEPEHRTVHAPPQTFRVRPPTGADDEACWAAAADPDEQAALLWGRLVSRVDTATAAAEPEPLGRDGWMALDPATRQLLAAGLAAGDEVLDLAFVSPCPRCRALIELELDPVEVLVRSLQAGEGRLLAEVHCLAYHYGWSETDILDLARPRRLAYLELIRRQLEGRPLVDVWS